MELSQRRRSHARFLPVLVAAAAAIAVSLPAHPAGAAPLGSAADWTQATLPQYYQVADGGPAIAPVSCAPGTEFCLTIGNYQPPGLNGYIPQATLVSDDGGQTWQGYNNLAPDPLPPDYVPTNIVSVSCPSAATCWAVGTGNVDAGGAYAPMLLQSTDGGQTWTDTTPAAWNQEDWLATQIDCISASTCWVIGNDDGGAHTTWLPNVTETTDGGATWSQFSNIPLTTPAVVGEYTGLYGISCTSALACVLVGGSAGWGGSATVISTIDGGATWSQSTDPALAGIQALLSVSCVPGSGGLATCTAAGTAFNGAGPVMITSTDGGTTWSGFETAAGAGGLNAVSCADALHCWVAGNPDDSSALIGTDDGGNTWSQASVPGDQYESGQVSCVTASSCVATTDEAIWVTTDDGGLSAAQRGTGSASAQGQARTAVSAKRFYEALPQVSGSSVAARAGHRVTITGQYVGKKDSKAPHTAKVVITTPGGKQTTSHVRIGLNRYYSVTIGKLAVGRTKVIFTATGTKAHVVYVHGFPAPAPRITSLSVRAGPTTGGTKLTISGTNFRHVTAVYFGSRRAARVRVLSAGKISVTAPAGSRARQVTVVTTRGGPSVLTGRAIYNYLPRPMLTRLSPATGPAAGGTTVTITGNWFGFVKTVDFGAHAASHVRVISAHEITVTAPAGTGTAAVRIVTAGGTTPAGPADRYTY